VSRKVVGIPDFSKVLINNLVTSGVEAVQIEPGVGFRGIGLT
jgi:hypothetical protein